MGQLHVFFSTFYFESASADSPFFPVISFSRKYYSWKYKSKLFGMLSVNSKNQHLTTILQRFIFNWEKQPFLVSADSHAKFHVLFLRLGSAISESTRILSSILTVFSKKKKSARKKDMLTQKQKNQLLNSFCHFETQSC